MVNKILPEISNDLPFSASKMEDENIVFQKSGEITVKHGKPFEGK